MSSRLVIFGIMGPYARRRHHGEKRQGSPTKGRKRPGFPCPSRVDGRSIGTQDTGNVRRVAAEETPGAGQTDPTRSDGVCSRTGIDDGFCFVHQVFAKCTIRSVCRPGRVHQRNVDDDAEVLQLLFRAAEDFARTNVPESVSKAFMAASMTALQKHDGGVRGIATGTTFRRLVAKTLVRQFSAEGEAACAPYRFALSTRAGTDCVGPAIRAMSDAVTKVYNVPGLRALLPFVRATCGQPTEYEWEDETGLRHTVRQAEGGDQGYPLMPLLFSLAIHDSLVEANREMDRSEYLLAFLDDVHAVFSPHRTRPLYKILGEVGHGAGIRLHAGKTRVWNREAICPPDIQEIGDEVWNPEGIKILGTPVGSHHFVEGEVAKRLDEERKLWEAIPCVPDLQCAWQIFVQCAGPRCHHMLRTLPPSQSQ